MAFSLPSDLATNWADNVGMIENAAYLNAVAAMNNSLKAALVSTVNGATQAIVVTSESTTSNTYTDLTTTTDSVTVTISNSGMALVILYAYMTCVAPNDYQCRMSYAISGATTKAADDARFVSHSGQYSTNSAAYGATFLETGLTAGSTTFKAKYRSSTTTSATFANRRIAVIPFF